MVVDLKVNDDSHLGAFAAQCYSLQNAGVIVVDADAFGLDAAAVAFLASVEAAAAAVAAVGDDFAGAVVVVADEAFEALDLRVHDDEPFAFQVLDTYLAELNSVVSSLDSVPSLSLGRSRENNPASWGTFLQDLAGN